MKKFFKRSLAALLAVVMVVNFMYLGVFAQETTQVETVTDGYEFSKTTALGNVVSQALDTQTESFESGYAISKTEFNGKVATVSIVNAEACKLVIAIYSENGQMLGAGVTDVNAAIGTAEVTIEIKTMPEYFTAKGFLLDENMAALCEPYTCIRYSKMFQDFLNKTVDDFAGQNVITFDESKNNNFAVLPDEAKIYNSNGVTNELFSVDNENGVYVFNNPDDNIRNLSKGQIFYFNDETNSIIIKVKSVYNSRSQAIVYAEEAELEELFEYIKIHDEAYAGKDDIDTSTMDRDVTLVDVQTEKIGSKSQFGYGTQPQDIDEDFVGSIKLNLKLKKEGKSSEGIPYSVEGNINLKIKVEIELYYDMKWGNDYFDFSFVTSQETGGSVSFNLPVKNKFAINLPSATVPLCGGVVQLKLQPKFVVSGKASLKIEFSKKEKLGFTFNSENDLRPINEQETEYTPSTEAAIELKFGIEMGASTDIIKIITLKLTVGAGISIKGTLETQSLEHGNDTIHFCSYCINGDMKLYADFEIKFEVDILGKVLFEPSYKDDFTLKFGDFYISINDKNVKFGLGVCPDKAHRVTFEVTDKIGAAVPGAIVSGADDFLKRFNNNSTNAVTDEAGKAIYYYTNGRYTVTASAQKFLSQDKTFGVDNNTQNVKITLEPTKDERKVLASGDVCSENYGYDCDGGHAWFTLYDDGEIVISGTGDMHGGGESGTIFPWSCYFTDDDYSSLVKKVTIEEGITTVYGFSGYLNPNIEEVSLPESTLAIYGSAFSGTKISEIYIPKNVEYIYHSFANCQNLSSITVDSANKHFTADSNGVLYNKDKTTLVQFPAGSKKTSYTLPSTVKRIEDSAFSCSRKLTKVVLNTGLKTIGSGAFEYCEKLSSVNIPSTVTELGEILNTGVFTGCTSLTSISIPHGIEDIYYDTFGWCENLRSVTIPTSVTYIHCGAFSACDKLYDVYYAGTENQWNNIDTHGGSMAVTFPNATIHYNSTGARSASIQSVTSSQALRTVSNAVTASSISFDSCVAGNSYIILYASGYSIPFTLESKNIFYIDQVVADQNGDVDISFMPKSAERTAFKIIAGDFGNGKTEMIVISCPEHPVFSSDHVSVIYKSSSSLPSTHPNVVYTSSNPDVISVDESGNITAKKTGAVTITAFVEGTDLTDTCEVTSSYAWWQWIIRILLLGFLWY